MRYFSVHMLDCNGHFMASGFKRGYSADEVAERFRLQYASDNLYRVTHGHSFPPAPWTTNVTEVIRR